MKKQLLSFSIIAIIFNVVQTASAQTYYITTIAGNQTPGYNGDGIAATTAELNDPLNTCTDKFGNVYIADNFNYRIRKVDVNGVITTYAGNGISGYNGDGGAATDAELQAPSAMSCDDNGNLYIADFSSNVVRKVDKNGVITTFAGNGNSFYSGDGGPATDAGIGFPRSATRDNSGNIYIVDQTNYRLRKVDTRDIITTVAGDGINGYMGDGGAATDAELSDPTAVAVDGSGNIYIADATNNVIRMVNTKGIITTFAGTGTAGFSGDGGQATDAELDDPLGVATDNAGNIYIVDLSSQRLRKVDINGVINTIAGTGIEGHTGDGGPATLADLGDPIGVSTDSLDNIYITEYLIGNNDVREITHCTLTLTVDPPSPPPICSGQSITLTAGGGASYQWSPSAGLNTTSGDTILASPSLTTTYSVTASDSAGCSATTYVVVTVSAPAPLIIQPQSPSVCPGQNVALSVPVSGTDYTWSPASTLSSSTADTVVASPSVQTTYMVTGTDSLGCVVSDSDVVYISSAPNKPNITHQGTLLTSSATQGNQWVRNDTALGGATNQTYNVTQAGWYEVIAENPANGCSTTSDSVYINPTGINQLTVESGQLTVYPNPTGGEINVSINSSARDVDNWNLQVTDMLGRTVLTMSPLRRRTDSSPWRINPLKGTFEIDLSNLSSGVYFICVVNKTGRAVVPVVKQ